MLASPVPYHLFQYLDAVMVIFKMTASLFGVGYIRGGGTVAAFIYVLIWALLKIGELSAWGQLLIIGLILLVGIAVSTFVEKDWGHDSNKVVIDEVAGMSVALFLVPNNFYFMGTALILFRFFDIAKPLFIRNVEKIQGGMGVMLDDVLAGMYSIVLLQILILIVG